MSKFPKITHVIYDLDGLLLSTETFHTKVNQTIAKRYGKTFDKSIKSKTNGRNAFDSAQILVEMLQLPLTPQEYMQQRNQLIYQLYPQAQPLAGAVGLTKHLASYQIPQAVATSSASYPFELKTSHHQEWFTLFNCIVLGDDPAINQGKPAPDIFLIAAERLGASPEQCLVFEDSIAGMEAAKAAGMSVVVVPDPNMERELYYSANQVLKSLEDFEPQRWQLPAFNY
ncbi:MAG: HAD-IA family hydrolase [Symploca sp. SIO1C4]|uniref:HAD-IA family hydrolase n=1 Tax=Symploca sp. SIO1C4 TaxID=2607765 RepID=A0A6B3NEH7_9CYAN|nr:HAD-IA family hydrolase [Symploca sp. SIO1C4]